MSIGIEEERLREIEQDQAGLRASIDDAKRLAEQAEYVLDKRRHGPPAGPGPNPLSSRQ